MRNLLITMPAIPSVWYSSLLSMALFTVMLSLSVVQHSSSFKEWTRHTRVHISFVETGVVYKVQRDIHVVLIMKLDVIREGMKLYHHRHRKVFRQQHLTLI